VELGGLTLEGAGHEALSEQLKAPHLGLHPTSSMMTVPDGPAEVAGRSHNLIASLGAGCRRLRRW
jgi:hypothetical protein